MNNVGETSLQRVLRGQYNSRERGVGIEQQSIEDLELNTLQNDNQMTSQMMPSHLESNPRTSQIAILLLESNQSANVKVGKNGVETPLCQLIEGEHFIRGDCVGAIQSLTRA